MFLCQRTYTELMITIMDYMQTSTKRDAVFCHRVILILFVIMTDTVVDG